MRIPLTITHGEGEQAVLCVNEIEFYCNHGSDTRVCMKSGAVIDLKNINTNTFNNLVSFELEKREKDRENW